MSSIVPLRCLLCKHLNPADAVFCNKCGTQLDLQACGRCGALNERVAQNCSQCGGRLTVPATPESGSLLAPATPVKDAAPAAPGDAAGAGPEVVHSRHDLAHSPPETQAVDDTFLSEMDAASLMWRQLEERTPDQTVSAEAAAAATRSRRRWLVMGAALLIALVMNFVFVYVRDDQPGQLEQKAAQGEREAAPDVPGAPAPAEVASSPAEARVDSALTLETGNDGLEKPSSPAQADVQTRQAPPQFTDCPPAVAALGLCNPDTKQEGH